jgi:hypothetical protein
MKSDPPAKSWQLNNGLLTLMRSAGCLQQLNLLLFFVLHEGDGENSGSPM